MLEARVLGVLIEKAHTVPDSYPLSLNSLTLGCNQKTAREPVLNALESEVQDAVIALKALNLVFEASGSRVTRYEHNAPRTLALAVGGGRAAGDAGAARAADGVGAAHGIEAPASLRRSVVGRGLSRRVGRRAAKRRAVRSSSSCRAAPGAREPRWAHLLSGAVDVSAMPIASDSVDFVAASEMAALKAQHGAMQTELTELRGLVERLYAELGVART